MSSTEDNNSAGESATYYHHQQQHRGTVSGGGAVETSAGGGTATNTIGGYSNSTTHAGNKTAAAGGGATKNCFTRILDRVFRSCSDDPKGSVHRAWGISLIFVIIYFAVAIFAMGSLRINGGSNSSSGDGSTALILAAIWAGIIHLILGVLGTFVLKRFPTQFAIGFLLGIVIVVSNQNLIMWIIFRGYNDNGSGDGHTLRTHSWFATCGFTLFVVLGSFAVLLFHFQDYIIVTAADAAKLGGSSNSGANQGGFSLMGGGRSSKTRRQQQEQNRDSTSSPESTVESSNFNDHA